MFSSVCEGRGGHTRRQFKCYNKLNNAEVYQNWNSMIALLCRLKGQRSAEYRQANGLALAVATLDAFRDRSFRVKGMGIKNDNVPGEEVIRFIEEELPDYYTYNTQAKTYANRHAIPQAHVTITGTMGLSRRLNRYNPLDLKCTIRSNTRKQAR